MHESALDLLHFEVLLGSESTSGCLTHLDSRRNVLRFRNVDCIYFRWTQHLI